MVYTASVIKGKGRGTGLGFPTLNLEIPKKFEARQGIYAGYVYENRIKYQAAIYYGSVPTFDEEALTLEAFLLDTVLTKRPRKVQFELVAFIREVLKFPDTQALSAQIVRDVEEARRVLP